jgi:hypothetical protein
MNEEQDPFHFHFSWPFKSMLHHLRCIGENCMEVWREIRNCHLANYVVSVETHTLTFVEPDGDTLDYVCRVTRYPRRFLIEEEFVNTWEDPTYDEGRMLASRLAKWKEEILAFYVQKGLPIELCVIVIAIYGGRVRSTTTETRLMRCNG